MTYVWKAQTRDKLKIVGEGNWESEGALLEELKGMGLTSISLKKSVILRKDKASINSLVIFLRLFSEVIKTGIPILQGIKIIQSELRDRKFKNKLALVYLKVSGGESLYTAFKMCDGFFPSYFLAMFVMGEQTGTLDLICSRLADYYEKQQKNKQNLIAAVAYPILLVSATMCVTAFLTFYIIPQFYDVIQSMGGKPTGTLSVVMSINKFVKGNYLFIVASILISVGCLVYYLRTESGKYMFDSFKLKIPLLGGIIRDLLTIQFSQSLSTMLYSGTAILRSLELTKEVVGNRKMQKDIDNLILSIRSDGSIIQGLSLSSTFSSLMVQTVTIGEKSGSIDTLLEDVCSLLETSCNSKIKILKSFIEPVIILIIATLVGLTALSLINPLFNLMNSLRGA